MSITIDVSQLATWNSGECYGCHTAQLLSLLSENQVAKTRTF